MQLRSLKSEKRQKKQKALRMKQNNKVKELNEMPETLQPMSLLENRIGYEFKDKMKLEEALTHSSYSNELGQKHIIKNCNERLEKLLAENTKVEYARTTVPTYNFDLQSRLHLFNPTCALLKDKGELLSLWERFVSTEVEGIQLFYIWGHTYELDVNDDWQFFEEFCKLISNNPNVYYCTNIEAFDYIKSKNN
jgi:hypothetical protein